MNAVRTAIGLAALVTMAIGIAHADEQTIRRVVGAKLPDAKIVSVQKLRRGGLYEVAIQRAEGGIAVFYTDDSAQVFFIGRLVDTATDQDLTEERVRKLSAIDWNALPFKWAITMKRGDGRRRIAILSDPNCPYCKRFEADLATLDDITIHIFPYPVIKPESVRQAKAVWCSRDRVKAWNDLMHQRIEPTAKPDCETPIEQLVALGQRLGANSTPTWLLPNGEKRSGAMKMSDLVPLLDATARGR
ncbi:MAG: DsbC family protein [Burkholderiales bacterium]